MLELKGISGAFYTASEWIMRFSGVNLLWFVLSLPFFLLFVAVDMSTSAGISFFGAAGWLFASLLFYPATAAVFNIVRDWIVEEDTSSIVKKYFTHFKYDYKSNVKSGAVFALVWLLWYYGTFYSFAEKSTGALIFLVIGLGLFIYTVNFLSINSHYRMSIRSKMLNAFFLSAGRPLLGLFIIFSSGILVWLSATQLLWLLPLLSCSLTAFLSFSAFYRTTQKVERQMATEETE